MVYFVSYKAFLIFIYRRIRSTREKHINCCDGGRGDSQQPHNHFHYEKRLTCLQQNLIVRGCYYIRTTFLLVIPQTQTARRMTPSFTRFSLGIIQKTENTSQKPMVRLHAFSSNTLSPIHFHNEKGWSTKLRLTNHLYILFLSASASLTALKSSSYGTTSVERTNVSMPSANTRAASHIIIASVRLPL